MLHFASVEMRVALTWLKSTRKSSRRQLSSVLAAFQSSRRCNDKIRSKCSWRASVRRSFSGMGTAGASCFSSSLFSASLPPSSFAAEGSSAFSAGAAGVWSSITAVDRALVLLAGMAVLPAALSAGAAASPSAFSSASLNTTTNSSTAAVSPAPSEGSA